jgi:hypothetical protein
MVRCTPQSTLHPTLTPRLCALVCAEVVQAKAGAGSATLSMAWAAARFADACLRAMGGEGGVVECAYVSSTITSLPFFASQVGQHVGSTALGITGLLGPSPCCLLMSFPVVCLAQRVG